MINEMLDKIYEIEEKPFKINISFGTIWEKPNKKYDDKQTTNQSKFEYTYNNANDEDSKNNPPVTIRNNETKVLAKQTIKESIINKITFPGGNSSTKLICIYSVMIKVFRLSFIGTVAPGLEMFIQNKFLIKSLEDDNLCWDFCGTVFSEPKLKEYHRKTRTRVNAYKRIMKKDPPGNYKVDF